MSPVSVAGTLTQVLAEVLAGTAFIQLVRPGAPVIFGTFVSTLSMQSGAPTFGTPEAAKAIYGAAQLARRLNMPFRTGGSLVRLQDSGCPGRLRERADAAADAARRDQLRAACGRLDRGRALASSYEKLIMDMDQLGMMHVLARGIDLSENGQAMDALREVGPGGHFLGCAHTQANFETAFYRSSVADNNSVEQWEAEGAQGHAAARQCDLEEDARRIRAAADRSRDGRGPAGVHPKAQGLDAGRMALKP